MRAALTDLRPELQGPHTTPVCFTPRVMNRVLPGLIGPDGVAFPKKAIFYTNTPSR